MERVVFFSLLSVIILSAIVKCKDKNNDPRMMGKIYKDVDRRSIDILNNNQYSNKHQLLRNKIFGAVPPVKPEGSHKVYTAFPLNYHPEIIYSYNIPKKRAPKRRQKRSIYDTNNTGNNGKYQIVETTLEKVEDNIKKTIIAREIGAALRRYVDEDTDPPIKRKRGIKSLVINKEPNKDELKKQKGRRLLTSNRRLTGGITALIEDYPYVVSIQKGKEHWCTGAILNPRIIITTANCMWKSKQLSRMKVRAGSRFPTNGGMVVGIQEVVKHPRWSIHSDPDFDVALLLLSQPLKFSDSIHGADLPNRGMKPAFNDAWIASWGAERRDGIYTSPGLSLKAYHAELIDIGKCNNITKRYGVIVTENFFCLGQEEKKSPCTRDTGAPAVSDGVVWGLASWGIRRLCGTARHPSMFSYLGSAGNMEFIINATHVLMSQERNPPFLDGIND